MTVEELIFAPTDDEQYAKRMKLLRENFKFFKIKYGKIANKIAERNFRIMFEEVLV